jgi:hypothetical protein
MVSTPTTILRLELQGAQDNPGAWNTNANQVFSTVEEAIAGFYDVSTTGGDTTLAPVNYATDTARRPYLRISSGQTLISNVRVVSATPRKFLVHNASSAGDFTVKFGGSTGNALVIPRGCICEILVRSDLTTVYASPLIVVADGQIHEDSLTDLYSKFPVVSANTDFGVLSSTLATPPGSPTTGDRYIVPVGGLVAWTGQDANIAEWDGAAWDYTSPVAGMVAWDRANHWFVGYDASGWNKGAVTDPIPSGGVTHMMFWQASAPTGWTKGATHNNKGIRVTTGTGGSGGGGGTVGFSTLFGLTATDGYTLATSDIASHTHTGTTGSENNSHSHQYVAPASETGSADFSITQEQTSTTLSTGTQSANHQHAFTSAATGGGGSHAHAIDLRLAYLDMILCSRD